MTKLETLSPLLHSLTVATDQIEICRIMKEYNDDHRSDFFPCDSIPFPKESGRDYVIRWRKFRTDSKSFEMSIRQDGQECGFWHMDLSKLAIALTAYNSYGAKIIDQS